MSVHMLVQCSVSCKAFITQVTVYYSVILSVVIIQFFNRTKGLFADFAPYGTSVTLKLSPLHFCHTKRMHWSTLTVDLVVQLRLQFELSWATGNIMMR